eukprot:1185854-Prorocentrum_minimum.AAC.1
MAYEDDTWPCELLQFDACQAGDPNQPVEHLVGVVFRALSPALGSLGDHPPVAIPYERARCLMSASLTHLPYGDDCAGRSTATAVIALMPTDGMRGCNLAVLTTADASCRSGREDGEDEPGMRIKRLCDGRRMLDW